MIYLLKTTKVVFCLGSNNFKPSITFPDDILDDMFLFEICEKLSNKSDREIIKQKLFHFCPSVVLQDDYIDFLKTYNFYQITDISRYYHVLINDEDVKNAQLIRSYKLKTISEW